MVLFFLGGGGGGGRWVVKFDVFLKLIFPQLIFTHCPATHMQKGGGRMIVHQIKK